MKEIFITVKAKTKSKERSIELIDDNCTYVVKTPHAPEKDRANKDIVDIISRHFKVPKSGVILTKGRRSKTKIFKIIA